MWICTHNILVFLRPIALVNNLTGRGSLEGAALSYARGLLMFFVVPFYKCYICHMFRLHKIIIRYFYIIVALFCFYSSLFQNLAEARSDYY
jgi:uncharacterized membrane protein YtjA (UPF0391 family)